MAHLRICDSCGKDISNDMTGMTQVMTSRPGNAGVSVDLCAACSADLMKDKKLLKAIDTFDKKMQTIMDGTKK
jgi:hypothetical protein